MASEVEPSPLCCCEYLNIKGERTHLLALLCDCEDLDNTVDQCLKGNKITSEKFTVISNVITDRIRIPWPQGARKLDMEGIIPIILLPSSLYFASWNFVFTVLTLVYLPIFVFVYYVYALRARKRTWFFVSWASTSVIGIYVMYMLNISQRLSRNYTVAITLGFALIIFFYYRVVKSKNRLHTFVETTTSEQELNSENGSLNCGTNGVKVNSENLTCCFCDYGPFSRSKHCRICGHCVPRSDHHCVWTNCCIGIHNQGSFLLAIFSFVVTGGWGIHLSLQTICKPISNAWYMDCSQVYSDPGASVMFVCAFYSVVFILSMSLLLVQQLFFISFNITGDEWRRGSKRRTLLQVLWMNQHNKGLLQNWRDFLLYRRLRVQKRRRYELI